MSRAEVQKLFTTLLDSMQNCGCNAVVFQVRPCADAFYKSTIEPWSRYLSGVQGVAPKEEWDPMQFMIEESHKRGMEFHAWCNPYRVTLQEGDSLCEEHAYFKHKEIFVKHGKQLYFNPAEPLSRELTIKAIADIVERYDIEAIHFDDYFYPYPIAGEEFNDQVAFDKYAAAQGFIVNDKLQLDSIKADWRRYNVELLIKELNDTIKAIKPWVRFGISPFGIHRNKKDTPDNSGSDTNGLSNYDALYADVPRWAEIGIIDYVVPQIYWKIGHNLADYKVLIKWWNNYLKRGHLYIGQNISTFSEKDLTNPNTTQMREKMQLVRELPNVMGNIWWPAWSLEKNVANVKDSLRIKYQRELALVPAYTSLDDKAPLKLKTISLIKGSLMWKQAEKDADDPMQQALFYAIYSFPKGEEIDINNPKYLLKLTKNKKFNPVKENPNHKEGDRYLVTVIDKCWNESKPSKIFEF